MLRQMSEEVRSALRDRLRDVRHAIRLHRHDSGRSPLALLGDRLNLPPPPPGAQGVEILLGHAVSALDDAMTAAERFAPLERASPPEAAIARGFMTYFPAGDALDGARLFRRDLYALAGAVLALRGPADARIHETALAAIHGALRARHGALLAALGDAPDWTGRVAATSSLCAALLLELLDHRPLRFGGATQDAGRRLEIVCLSALVLACGVASVEPDTPTQPGLIGLALHVAEAHLDRIVACCCGADGAEELTRIFAMLLPHLP